MATLNVAVGLRQPVRAVSACNGTFCRDHGQSLIPGRKTSAFGEEVPQ